MTFDRAYNGVANSHAVVRLAPALRHRRARRSSTPAAAREWAAYREYDDAFADALAAQRGARRGGARAGLPPGADPAAAARAAARPADRRTSATRRGRRRSTSACCPTTSRREVLLGMLGADAVGFHSARWADAFGRCCAEVLGRDVGRPRGRHDGPHHPGARCTRSASTPTSCAACAGAPDVQGRLPLLREIVGDRQLLLRIDRTELSKNIVRGLEAYRELLRTRPRVARAGRAPGLRLPVAARPAGVPRVHRRGAAGRPRGQRGVRAGRAGCPCTSRCATTTRARSRRTRWPTCCWSTRCATA